MSSTFLLGVHFRVPVSGLDSPPLCRFGFGAAELVSVLYLGPGPHSSIVYEYPSQSWLWYEVWASFPFAGHEFFLHTLALYWKEVASEFHVFLLF